MRKKTYNKAVHKFVFGFSSPQFVIACHFNRDQTFGQSTIIDVGNVARRHYLRYQKRAWSVRFDSFYDILLCL